MDHPSSVLIRETKKQCPDTYREILDLIKPHSIDAVEQKLRHHLDTSDVDLNIFNENRESISEFLLEYVKRIRENFPTPGDAIGIHASCRMTRNVTQNILDSRHPTSSVYMNETDNISYRPSGLHKALKYEMNLYKIQTQFLEITCKRKFSSVYIRNYQVNDIFSMFPHELCLLDVNTLNEIRGYPLKFARFILTEEHKRLRIFYHQHHSRDLSCLVKHLDFGKIEAFNDMRLVYNKLGPTCFFHNAENILNLYFKDDPRHFMDMITALKIMTASGYLVGQNRNGLAKHPDRTIIEIFGFEAPRNNAVKVSTSEKVYESNGLNSSTCNMYFGICPNEGTGANFTVLSKKKHTVI